MKRFTFRLERLRELRERAEREQASVLGAAMRDEQRERDALERARRAFDRIGEQAGRSAEHATLPAGVLGNLGLTRDLAGAHVEAASEAVKEAEVRVSAELERYGEKRRELRVVEKLKEKRFETWKDDVSRAEQKDVDDVALRRRGQAREGKP
ncbi:MAG: flagellar export protein FliJ [Burkholderiaceae bacterium]